MSGFPNVETQFRGGERLGKPRPAIGKRKARKLKVALAVAEAVHGPQPAFDGDSLDFLRGVMKGQIRPDPAQLSAALALSKFEHPALSASMTANVNQLAGQNSEPLAIDFRWADATTVFPGHYDLMTNEELDLEIARLQALRRAEAPADG